MRRLVDCVILPAGPADADDLARVHVRAWRETYAGLLPDGYLAAMSVPLQARRWRHQLTLARAGELVLAAEGPDGPVGYCAGALHLASPDRAEIFTLYLLCDFQGLGLERRLMESAARVFQGQGASALALWVLAGNLRARRFYRHLGGALGAERAVRGWGGDLREVCYGWERIERLAGG